MNRIAAAMLSLEAIVVLLAIPAAVQLSGEATAVVVPVGLGLALACFVAAGLVRRAVWSRPTGGGGPQARTARGRAGYVLGTLVQLAAVAAGFVVPVMVILGVVFAVLWFVLLRIGPRVERGQVGRRADHPG